MSKLTRKFLVALGIEDEGKQDEIIEAHRDVVDELKSERDTYKETAEKLPAIQKELDDLKQAAEKNENNPYKAQYEDLKKEYDEYKTSVAEKETKAKKTAAYRKLLKDAGISEKYVDSIMKVSVVDDYELDGDNIKDADKHKTAAKEKWADFVVEEKKEGAKTPTPPAGAGGGAGKVLSRAAQVAARHNEMMYGVKGDKE